MGKSEGKIEPLVLLRLVSVLAFIMFSGLTLLLVVNNFYGSTILSLLIISSLVFAVGNVKKKEGFVLSAWFGVGSIFVAVQIFFLPGVSYLSALAGVMMMLVFIDLAHFLGICQPSIRDGRRSKESMRTWSLVKKHLSFVCVLAVLSYVISLAVMSLSLPVQFTFNPVIGIAVLASAALLLVTGLASEKRARI